MKIDHTTVRKNLKAHLTQQGLQTLVFIWENMYVAEDGTPDVIPAACRKTGATICDILDGCVRYGKTIPTEKQMAFLKSLLARYEDITKPKAPGTPVKTGRYFFIGKVLSAKTVENPSYYRFGGDEELQKVLILMADGTKVYGNVPVYWDIDPGCGIKMTATISASPDDPSFGFYKRAVVKDVTDPA